MRSDAAFGVSGYSLPEKLRFHDLRHTFASHWMMRGGDLFRLQKVLGHKSIEMTQRYAHLAPEAFQQDWGRLGAHVPVVAAPPRPVRQEGPDGLGAPAAAVLAALKALPEGSWLGRSALVAAAGIGEDAWLRAIRELRAKDLVISEGANRGQRYRSVE